LLDLPDRTDVRTRLHTSSVAKALLIGPYPQ
jgi:hypothetical protein